MNGKVQSTPGPRLYRYITIYEYCIVCVYILLRFTSQIKICTLTFRLVP